MSVDPDWSQDEVNAASKRWLAENPDRRITDPKGPIFQQAALQEIRQLEICHAQGNRGALMAAIRKCANHGLVMPEWVSEGFIAGHDKVLKCLVKSWDDAFGPPFPKGANLAAIRKRRKNLLKVHAEVIRIAQSEPDIAIGPELFERAGKPFGIGKTLAESYYYDAIHRFGLWSAHELRHSTLRLRVRPADPENSAGLHETDR